MARRTWTEWAFAAVITYVIGVLAFQLLSMLVGYNPHLKAFHFPGVPIPSANEYALLYSGMNKTHWKGWPSIDHLFIFGDSWTTTGFEIDGAQPTSENPWGNPEWDPANWHLQAAENWVGFITAVHNQSMMRTVNLAYGGATVDMDLIHPFAEKPPGMRDLGYQVNELFKPTYEDHPDSFDWTQDNALFIIWIGLNDIHNADDETKEKFPEVHERYKEDLVDLYNLGARNFMLMNIPPIESSPLAETEERVDDWSRWVEEWNKDVLGLAANITVDYPDTTVFMFDTYKLFTAVMTDPCSHTETCAFRDTTTFCGAYAFGTDDWNSKSEECEYRVDEYLWMNDIHPTARMHNLTAKAMAEAMMAE